MKNEIEIAVIDQLPKITERIKEVGGELDKRLKSLHLDTIECNEENRKELKNLRADVKAELQIYEEQRKMIKQKITEPYEIFNKTYEQEIKVKFQQADLILKTKIDEVEGGIKNRIEQLAREFFDEYKKSKSVIDDSYLKFEELDLKIGLNDLTDKGQLVKKVKDAIIEKVDKVEQDISTIKTMDNSDEMLVEYLKSKNLPVAIKDVNDRHLALNQMRRIEESAKETVEIEEQVVEKVDEVLQAPIVEENNSSEILTLTFKVHATREKLKVLKQFLIEGGYDYE